MTCSLRGRRFAGRRKDELRRDRKAPFMFRAPCSYSRALVPTVHLSATGSSKMKKSRSFSLFQAFRYWSAALSQRARKNVKPERERGTNFALTPYPTPSVVFLLTPPCAVPTIWTPGTDYLPLYNPFLKSI